jgi:uncharacterized protein (DUF2141 family)
MVANLEWIQDLNHGLGTCLSRLIHTQEHVMNHIQSATQSMFRQVIRAAVIASLAGAIAHAAHAGGRLTIDVQDVNEPTGKLMIKLVDSKDAYDGKAKQIAGQMIEITQTGNIEVKFEDLKPGSYAVMIMHDENSNGKLDSNIIGIPKEGYGFSNNPRVMRQPTFDETKFEVKEGENKIVISII